jgi:hypothetical protein
MRCKLFHVTRKKTGSAKKSETGQTGSLFSWIYKLTNTALDGRMPEICAPASWSKSAPRQYKGSKALS